MKTGLLVIAVALLSVNTFFLYSVYSSSQDKYFNPQEHSLPDISSPQMSHAAKGIPEPPRPTIKEEKVSGPITTMSFDKEVHDFGTVLQDSENSYSFSFTNSGSEPLVIENAKGSCGCTVPDYPKKPILPGQTETIDVVYKPGKQSGNIQKTVTVTANTNPRHTIIKIKAQVNPVESNS